MNNFQWKLNRNSNIFIQENAFENDVCEMAAILSSGYELSLWWRNQMETFSALLAISEGNPPVNGQWRRALMFLRMNKCTIQFTQYKSN